MRSFSGKESGMSICQILREYGIAVWRVTLFSEFARKHEMDRFEAEPVFRRGLAWARKQGWIIPGLKTSGTRQRSRWRLTEEFPLMKLIFDGKVIKAVDDANNGFLLARVEIVESDHCSIERKQEILQSALMNAAPFKVHF